MLTALVVIIALTTSAPLVHAHEATHKGNHRHTAIPCVNTVLRGGAEAVREVAFPTALTERPLVLFGLPQSD
jgi:hypothetical protein